MKGKKEGLEEGKITKRKEDEEERMIDSEKRFFFTNLNFSILVLT